MTKPAKSLAVYIAMVVSPFYTPGTYKEHHEALVESCSFTRDPFALGSDTVGQIGMGPGEEDPF
jgi:hypothetical protein